jgi:hypothetical protein
MGSYRDPSYLRVSISCPIPLSRSYQLTTSVVGVAVSGAGFYLWRLSQGSEVVWDRSGDWRPWDKVSSRSSAPRIQLTN